MDYGHIYNPSVDVPPLRLPGRIYGPPGVEMGDSCSKVDGTADESESSAQDASMGPPAAVDATPPSNRRKRNVRNSIFRVGSQVRRVPYSPTQRASNYNHVSEAVKVNFEEAASEREGEPLGVVGLRNLGNTCFLNSSIQCLSATIPLTDYFLGYDYRSEINKDNFLGTGGKLVTAYAELMKKMWLEKALVVQPVQFKSQLERFSPIFRGNHQHDSQELLSFLLDGIHEDLNRIKKKPYIEDRDCDGTNDEQDAIEAWGNYLKRNKSLIVDIFQGQLKSELQCLRCRHKNIRFEPFMYLSLPISKDCRSLKDCLELYLAEEKLTGENKWYCGKCKEHRDATKKTELWILPPILIVHLKRFRFNENGRMGFKNDAPIDYPLEDWDLSSYVKSRGAEQPLFDLYAVSNHIGELGSGHYTAYALNRFTEKWHEFNDSRCRSVDERALRGNRSSAYVLQSKPRGQKRRFSRQSSPADSTAKRQSSRPLAPHTGQRQAVSRIFTKELHSNVNTNADFAPSCSAVSTQTNSKGRPSYTTPPSPRRGINISLENSDFCTSLCANNQA